jgi:hypothetical protein
MNKSMSQSCCLVTTALYCMDEKIKIGFYGRTPRSKNFNIMPLRLSDDQVCVCEDDLQ